MDCTEGDHQVTSNLLQTNTPLQTKDSPNDPGLANNHPPGLQRRDSSFDLLGNRPPTTLQRLACVDVPALPLQLLLRRHPEWATRPVAVVNRDCPQGTILWVNDRARHAKILPGLRYTAGHSLCPTLCAGEVSEADIRQGVELITHRLWHFSPEIEPCSHEPGVFWVNASGLERLEPSLAQWARRIASDLLELRLVARTAVGFSRFGTYAIAKTVRHQAILRDPDHERQSFMKVRLDQLNLQPSLRDDLAKLGTHTIKTFLKLPRDGLAKRFGIEALQFHRLASGDLEPPLDPVLPPQPIDVWAQLEQPETNSHRLLFVIKRLLHPLLKKTAARHHAVAELSFELGLDGGGTRENSIRPAKSTLDATLILDLLRLKLDSIALRTGVNEITLMIRSLPATTQQLALFRQSRRDLYAADRSFARIRAEFGPHSVVHARLQDRHLPEATFTWEPIEETKLPAPRNVNPDQRPLIRRLFQRPLPLPGRQRRNPDGWLIGGLQRGPAIQFRGPYVISGGWWAREVHREYHFVETDRGDMLWVYYDRRRRQWFLHGQVE